MKIRDRIKELKRIKSQDLIPHPMNWREHGEEQRDALRGILAQVGIADALLVREMEGGYQLINGHCRADLDSEVEWPCLVLDVDEKEAEFILATHDTVQNLAEINEEFQDLAEIDEEMLASLVSDLEFQSNKIRECFAEIEDAISQAGGDDDGDDDEEEDEEPAQGRRDPVGFQPAR